MILLGNMLSKIYMARTSVLFKASPKGWGIIGMQMLIGLTLFSTEHSCLIVYLSPEKNISKLEQHECDSVTA